MIQQLTIMVATASLALSLIAPAAQAQPVPRAGEECIVQVLNQTIKVRPDGRWSLPNIPSNGGQVRARLTCRRGDDVQYGQSDFFVIQPNAMNAIAPIEITTPLPGPTRVLVSLGGVVLDTAEQTAQLVVTGVYPGGAERDIAASAAGTSFLSSNPAVASVTDGGLVTAHQSGTVLLTAWNDGATGAVLASIVIGGDSDNDGLPDEYEVRIGLDPTDPIDARGDLDGDGLDNRGEFDNGSDPFVADTDGDGINDGEEATVGLDGFITSPVLVDTDGDLVSDPLEIATGTDPTDRNSVDFARAIASLALAPDKVFLAFNPVVGEASEQLAVVATMIDGTTLDLTTHPLTQFASTDLTIASLGLTPGQVFAGQDGNATVTADVPGHQAAVRVDVRTLRPKPIARMGLPCVGYGMAIVGDYVFVACGQGGLVVVDWRIKTRPAILTTLALPDRVFAIRVEGDTAWLAGWTAGLIGVDISDPAAPTLRSQLALEGFTRELSVRDGLALAALGADGFALVDVSDPDAPTLRSRTDDPDTEVFAVALTGDGRAALRTYQINAAATAIAIADLSNLAAPTVTHYPSAFQDLQVAATATHAFTAGPLGLGVYDLAAPAAPVAQIGFPSMALNDLAIAGDVMFGADFRLPVVGMGLVGVADSPVFAGTIDFSAYDQLNGFAVTADATRVALTAIWGVWRHGPLHSIGWSNLYLGQWDGFNDTGGAPPDCDVMTPPPSVAFQGETFSVEVQAEDDVNLDVVELSFEDEPARTTALAPFRFAVQAPFEGGDYRYTVRAIDGAGNVAECGTFDVAVVVTPACDQPDNCEDSDICTDNRCQGGVGCVVTPVDCDDGNACTEDSCDARLGCVHKPVACNDGDVCTYDTCDPATGCKTTPFVCDDGNACTDNPCVTGVGCLALPVDCDDGDVCTTDGCDADTGCKHPPVSCDDGNPCTTDTCGAPLAGCDHAPLGEGEACGVDATCQGGVCIASTDHTVTGLITDTWGTPFYGATVSAIGPPATSTTTALNGQFELGTNIANLTRIEIGYPGFSTRVAFIDPTTDAAVHGVLVPQCEGEVGNNPSVLACGVLTIQPHLPLRKAADNSEYIDAVYVKLAAAPGSASGYLALPGPIPDPGEVVGDFYGAFFVELWTSVGGQPGERLRWNTSGVTSAWLSGDCPEGTLEAQWLDEFNRRWLPLGTTEIVEEPCSMRVAIDHMGWHRMAPVDDNIIERPRCVTGKVVDGGGQAVKDAIVYVAGSWGPYSLGETVLTNADGTFCAPTGPQDAGEIVYAHSLKPGFEVTGAQFVEDQDGPLNVGTCPGTPDPRGECLPLASNLTLLAGCIQGTVRDLANDPVAGVTVTTGDGAWATTDELGHYCVGSGVTDDDGFLSQSVLVAADGGALPTRAAQYVSRPSQAGACGGACATAGDLILPTPPPTTCIQGYVDGWTGTCLAGECGTVRVGRSADNALLGEAVIGDGGEFCVDGLPLGTIADFWAWDIDGTCGSTTRPVLQHFVTPPNTQSCGSGLCAELFYAGVPCSVP